ncbi:MAG: flagellar basal body-associated FliL family protein [Bdellovibrionaceae bacterium]|nr:flagellar basal body-associated FliL family protein [Pseudobdellovibrionaceae bacterium]
MRENFSFIKEDELAEEKAAPPPAESAAPPAGGGKNNIIYLVLIIINMLFLAGVGWMIYQGKKKENAEPKIEHVIKGEHEAQEAEQKEEKQFVGKVVPLETFIVNLAGSKGRKVAKVMMELELKDNKDKNVADEIDKRKAQVRDIIIIILSAKKYEEISTKEGIENLKNEIKDTINSFLTNGKITNVFFTEFIYN